MLARSFDGVGESALFTPDRAPRHKRSTILERHSSERREQESLEMRSCSTQDAKCRLAVAESACELIELEA
jgi:hypothetical protein